MSKKEKNNQMSNNDETRIYDLGWLDGWEGNEKDDELKDDPNYIRGFKAGIEADTGYG